MVGISVTLQIIKKTLFLLIGHKFDRLCEMNNKVLFIIYSDYLDCHIINSNINVVHRFVYSTSTANNTLIVLIRGQMYVCMYVCCDMCTIYVYYVYIYTIFIFIFIIFIYTYITSLFFTFITLQNISFADDASALSPYNTIANYTFVA